MEKAKDTDSSEEHNHTNSTQKQKNKSETKFQKRPESSSIEQKDTSRLNNKSLDEKNSKDKIIFGVSQKTIDSYVQPQSQTNPFQLSEEQKFFVKNSNQTSLEGKTKKLDTNREEVEILDKAQVKNDNTTINQEIKSKYPAPPNQMTIFDRFSTAEIFEIRDKYQGKWCDASGQSRKYTKGELAVEHNVGIPRIIDVLQQHTIIDSKIGVRVLPDINRGNADLQECDRNNMPKQLDQVFSAELLSQLQPVRNKNDIQYKENLQKIVDHATDIKKNISTILSNYAEKICVEKVVLFRETLRKNEDQIIKLYNAGMGSTDIAKIFSYSMGFFDKYESIRAKSEGIKTAEVQILKIINENKSLTRKSFKPQKNEQKKNMIP